MLRSTRSPGAGVGGAHSTNFHSSLDVTIATSNELVSSNGLSKHVPLKHSLGNFGANEEGGGLGFCLHSRTSTLFTNVSECLAGV